MTCPSCGRRKGRRDCPALRASICTICCGTKRLVEIDCPETCVHLTTAREHPAAVVKKQQERDVAALLPSISHLTERQHQLFFLIHSVIARHKPDTFSRLLDEDVAQAVGRSRRHARNRWQRGSLRAHSGLARGAATRKGHHRDAGRGEVARNEDLRRRGGDCAASD